MRPKLGSGRVGGRASICHGAPVIAPWTETLEFTGPREGHDGPSEEAVRTGHIQRRRSVGTLIVVVRIGHLGSLDDGREDVSSLLHSGLYDA